MEKNNDILKQKPPTGRKKRSRGSKCLEKDVDIKPLENENSVLTPFAKCPDSGAPFRTSGARDDLLQSRTEELLARIEPHLSSSSTQSSILDTCGDDVDMILDYYRTSKTKRDEAHSTNYSGSCDDILYRWRLKREIRQKYFGINGNSSADVSVSAIPITSDTSVQTVQHTSVQTEQINEPAKSSPSGSFSKQHIIESMGVQRPEEMIYGPRGDGSDRLMRLSEACPDIYNERLSDESSLCTVTYSPVPIRIHEKLYSCNRSIDAEVQQLAQRIAEESVSVGDPLLDRLLWRQKALQILLGKIDRQLHAFLASQF